MSNSKEKHWADRQLDYGFNHIDWISTPALFKLLDKWKKERGYHPIKNPGARYHIKEKK